MGTISEISDTARWVASFRALETRRKDALFRDPLAGALAGARGRGIMRDVSHGSFFTSIFVVRTFVLDELLKEAVRRWDIDTVVNLGAGLDTRPYRLALPAALRWIEVDLPHVVAFKNRRLRRHRSRCRLERRALDLRDRDARRLLFADIDAHSKSCLIITEGLLIYLHEREVRRLAQDIRSHGSFRYWLADVTAPEYMRKGWSYVKDRMSRTISYRFGLSGDKKPFFKPLGWTVVDERFHSVEARRIRRPIDSDWFERFPYARRRASNSYILLESSAR